MPEYVIIGNSAAAIGAIEAIRKKDKEAGITLISDEPYHTYSRPLITYFLANKVTWQQMLYRPKGFYRQNKIETKLGQKVTKIEAKKKEVVLENGEKISFNKLLIATGGKPFIPPIKGLDKKGVFTFTTFDDAKKTQKFLPEVKKAVVLGGGLIGLKLAEALAQKWIEVTVVELADRVLSLILDEAASQLVELVFIENKVKFITGQSVKEIIGNEKVKGVILDNGDKISCELVIIAIGVIPRTKLAQEAGIRVDRGIIVDEFQKTNVKDIYAAGDVTEAYDLILKTHRPIPILPNAYLQGQVAGLNMAGKSATYPGSLSMNSVTFFGYPVISVGLTSLTAESSDNGFQVLTKKKFAQRIYRKLVLKDDCVQGFISAGNVDRSGIITNLIKEKVKVSKFKKKLIEEPLGLIVLPKNLREKFLKLGS